MNVSTDDQSDSTPASSMAAFLRDVAEVTTKQQTTIDAQVADGFAFWLAAASDLEGVRSAYVERPNDPPATVLEVSRPGPRPPDRRELSPDEFQALSETERAADWAEALRHRELQEQWQRHKDLYDNIFGSRTPPENMELVLATGLLTNDSARRHLVVTPVDVDLDRNTQTLRVTIADSARQELNWTDAGVRGTLGDAAAQLQELQDTLTYTEAQRAVDHVRASFGLAAVALNDDGSGSVSGKVGLGLAPALLLRKRDSSYLLQLLRDMADDMSEGGFVSEPFKMILSHTHRPDLLEVGGERPALPLPANEEQRAMIDNARRERHLVIQGPPGTGKTHTIANLASVLMAEGRRVLITAETDRALTEVQTKLPPDMRALMLPLLKERGTGNLQASVNELTKRAGRNITAEHRERIETEARQHIDSLTSRITAAEAELIRIAGADREDRTFDGTTMQIAGHLQALAAETERLVLVDRYLGSNGATAPVDAADLLRLSTIVSSAHQTFATHNFPEGLMQPEELAIWLQDHRSQLALLSDPTSFDHAILADHVDDLAKLSRLLHELPPTDWSEITRTPDDYRNAAEDVLAVAQHIDHGVTLDPPSAVAEAQNVCREYLSLDAHRFDLPIEQLSANFQKAARHAATATVLGEFDHAQLGQQLTKECEDAVELLRRDRSGLLAQHVGDLRSQGVSPVDTLVGEAESLIEHSRDGVGLPVTVRGDAPAPHELAHQAEVLLAHLANGGKMTRMLGAPKAVRDAQQLIDQVLVAGSPVDTEAEAARALEYFRYRTQVVKIDAWAERHGLTRPAGTSHHDWLVAITRLPAASAQVRAACDSASRLVRFPFGSEPAEPETFLMAVLATISQEVVDRLGGLVDASSNGPRISLDGLPIRSRADASRALSALDASTLRRDRHRMLPATWAQRCNPVDVDDGDLLADMLQIAAAAAEVPGQARTAELTPTAVNKIAERAQVDQRRADLADGYDRVIGGLQRRLTACVPQSPATQAIGAALTAEDASAYRIALEELDRERMMAEQATRLDAVHRRVSTVHPALVAAFDTGDPEAARVLHEIDEFERLRDYRVAVRRWKDSIGSADSVHAELASLHREYRRAEARLASHRCWSRAVDRLQSRRELRSALSALSNAMDAVPKTRTAKTYPARVRAVRAATRDAAPAIPCWVMSIDRVAEVLGYPTGGERFDVVIIDEASQAWFPAMFLYAIADQVIVVGDKMQTSPSRVLAVAELTAITREHISGHRLADRVGTDLSLYDVAEVMTGPDMMVDHFRCVPEIIDISNRLSYAPMGRSLQPSRVREPGALTPLKHVLVAGRRVGAAANVPEVEALVAQVVRCHASPSYAGMNFGVVVVGPRSDAHIKLLRTRLLETLGAQAMGERDIEVGNASQFQGAERNVMFLSLVEGPGPNERVRVWHHEHSGQAKQNVQRLNVAVSRARDQLWIFHSFSAAQLDPGDARLHVLQTPPAEGTTREEQRQRCQSQFERDVFDALLERDPELLVRTQVEALGYSIDLVVEDRSGHRLAVECDGDRWHSSDSQIRSDLYRQRTLEGIGWRFHRFLASEWYDDRDRHVNEILDALAESVSRRDESDSALERIGSEDTVQSSAIEDDRSQDGFQTMLPELDDGADLASELVLFAFEDGGRDHDAAGWRPSLETLTCRMCHRSWQREMQRGKKPLTCPECKSSVIEAARSANTSRSPSARATSSRAENKALAAALRARRKGQSGETWARAKKLLADGASIDEAADRA